MTTTSNATNFSSSPNGAADDSAASAVAAIRSPRRSPGDDPEDAASLSSSASPEGVTPPQQLYYGTATTANKAPGGGGSGGEEGHGISPAGSSTLSLDDVPLSNSSMLVRDGDDEPSLSSPSDEEATREDDSGDATSAAPAFFEAAACGVPRDLDGASLPLPVSTAASHMLTENPSSTAVFASEVPRAPSSSASPALAAEGVNLGVADPAEEEVDDSRPLTAEEEAYLLAAYESATGQNSQLMNRGDGIGEDDVGYDHDNEYDDIGAEDPPLTMEDTDSDLDPLSPRAEIAALDDVKGPMQPQPQHEFLPRFVDSGPDERLLAEYESKVVLGRDAMLHHRRLPSTIYEESTDATPVGAPKRRVDAGPELEPPLPRIVSGTFDGADLGVGPMNANGERQPLYPTGSSNYNNNMESFPDRFAPDTVRRPDFSPGSQPLSRPASFSHLQPPSLRPKHEKQQQNSPHQAFHPYFASARMYQSLSARLLRKHSTFAATWIGFWALFHITCVNYVLTPLRDAIAIKVGVRHIPMLTLASTGLAFVSSVPIGWLFEAPDPSRRKLWKRMGLTRGETQGTSLALFYRCFAVVLISYAVGFTGVEWLIERRAASSASTTPDEGISSWIAVASGKALYVAFFLVVHLMKLHSLSLVWGVTTEAMEYEEVAKRNEHTETTQTRLQRLALVGFGGTLGGIIGSGLASSMAQILKLPGLLILAAVLLEVGAELSIELGRIMQTHWETQQLFQSSNDLASLDASMRRSASLGSMKRVASGNSLSRVKSTSDLGKGGVPGNNSPEVNDGTFAQRLLRGVTTILRSRLLLAIFTYNALYASTTVLLSFQRAELVANRNNGTTAEADTAFLANINMASSIAIFALQASGVGAMLAHKCGPRGTLSLMPLIRLAGVLSLAWWHRFSSGRPPNLLVFLVVDECCKVMNLAVAKPVRESLWRGLSNEARYEAKPIVDTLANRWGGGSAAFLVSFIHHTLDWFGYGDETRSIQSHERSIFGFPPILFLCMVISAWWTLVSADLGQIRSRIDLELKKRQ